MILSLWIRKHVDSDCQSNQTYYGSDISVSTGKNSNDSSVKIVYEVINLADSKSDDGKNQGVNLRFGR